MNFSRPERIALILLLTSIMAVNGARLYFNLARRAPKLTVVSVEDEAGTVKNTADDKAMGEDNKRSAGAVDRLPASSRTCEPEGEIEKTASSAGENIRRKEDTSRISINSASASELCELPGIGPVLAQRIVEFRQKNGPFRRVEDLVFVPGIGEKTVERLKAVVTVD